MVCSRSLHQRIKLSRTDSTISYGDQSSSSLIQDLDLGSIDPSSTIDHVVYLRSPVASTRIVDLSIEASLTDPNSGTGQERSQHVEEISHTISIPISEPLDISSNVIYRHKSTSTGEDGVEGWASVMSVLDVPGTRDLEIEGITIEPRVSYHFLIRSSPRGIGHIRTTRLTSQNEAVHCVSTSLAQAAGGFPQSKSRAW